MTGAGLARKIRRNTRTNSTTFSDTDLGEDVNIFKDEIASRIEKRNMQFFQIPVTFNLVAGQRQYALPDDNMNQIQRVEVKFDSTKNYFPSTYKKDYLSSEAEAEIIKNFTNEEGEFFHIIRRRALILLSGTIISVTDGVRLWYHAYPADIDITSVLDMSFDPTTTSFGFPRRFHELLSRRVCIEYKGRQPKPIALSPKEQAYENDLEVALQEIPTDDNSGEVTGELVSPDNFGNNGQNF